MRLSEVKGEWRWIFFVCLKLFMIWGVHQLPWAIMIYLCTCLVLFLQKYPEHAIRKVLQLMLRRGEIQHRMQRKVLYRLK